MDKPFVRWCRLSVMCVVSCCVFFFSSLSFSADRVDVITIKGGIGPAVADYMVKALGKSNAEQAKLVVLTMDTPGGLSAAMRRMIQSILASSVPVVGFVTPSGARAASAGTYLLYAAHIAAMTPGTNLGAATPVSLFGGSADKQDKEKNKKDAGSSPSAMEKKVVNDAKAYIRSLAQLRGRNVEWAERAVSEGASLTASEALKQGVINFMSTDLTRLLKQVDGQVVSVKNKPYTIQLRDPVVRTIEPTWREQVLIWLTSPSVAYILLMVGIYGLFFEFTNPGLVVPGVVGAICILLSAYALQMLPVNYIGLALILLGVGFIVAEAFMPSFGVLGIGGAIALVVGSIMLFDSPVPGMGLPLGLILSVTAITVGLLSWVLYYVVRSHQRPIVSGVEEMVGAEGTIEKDADTCWLRYRGELWKVSNPDKWQDGDHVRIVSVADHVCEVEKKE